MNSYHKIFCKGGGFGWGAIWFFSDFGIFGGI